MANETTMLTTGLYEIPKNTPIEIAVSVSIGHPKEEENEEFEDDDVKVCTEHEKYCDAHPLCDGNCMDCPAYAENHFTNLGYYDDEDEEE